MGCSVVMFSCAVLGSCLAHNSLHMQHPSGASVMRHSYAV